MPNLHVISGKIWQQPMRSHHALNIKQICSTLASAGVQISMDELFLHALHGLPTEYDTITAALHARETPVTFEELHEKLLDFEQNLIRLSSSTTVPITTNFAAKPSYHNNRNHPRVTCQLCDKPGHHVKQCRKLLAILSLINGTGSDGHTRNNAQSQTQQPRANYSTHNTGNAGNRLVDSGASHHVMQDIQNLSLHSDYDGTEDIMLGDGNEHKITHTGSDSLPSSSRPLTLSNALCVPKMKKNLDLCTGAPLLAGKPKNGVYPWPSPLSSLTCPQALATTTTASTSNWHRRLGHPSSPTLRSTSPEAATSNHSSSNKPENSITSFPVPTLSTSSIPSSALIPNHPMVTRSKNNISKPTQRLCLSATLSPQDKSSPIAQPSTLKSTSSNTHSKPKPTRSLTSFNSILKPIEPKSISQALKDPKWCAAMNEELSSLKVKAHSLLYQSILKLNPSGLSGFFVLNTIPMEVLAAIMPDLLLKVSCNVQVLIMVKHILQ
ncbi:hypothetical protein KY284_025652 [Solanum tuberosum]|nr:hypothetical protein KY284_025652 [Solanum tuberosum]